MNAARVMERALWGGAIGLALLTAAGVRGAVPRQGALPAGVWPAPHRMHEIAPDSIARAEEVIAGGDVFRVERHPSAVAYRPELEGMPVPPPVPKPPRPALTVAGLVGGPPWAALLDGVPGRDGSVLVHAGDTLGGLRIRAVSPSSVTITGLDTVWHLTLKHTWP